MPYAYFHPIRRKIVMNKKLIVIVVILVSLASLGFTKLFGPRETGITATGTVEITRFDITPKISGYLKELLLEPGDLVTQGQIAARIDRPDLRVQILRDQAGLAKSEAQLRDLQNGSRSQEQGEAEAGLNSAQSIYEKAQADYERYNALYLQGAVSRQQLDAAKSSLDVAVGNLDTARQKMSLIQEGSRKEQITAQRDEVDRNRAIVKASKLMLDDTSLTVPAQGIVMTKNYQSGEDVTPGAAIYTIGNYEDCWVKIYISSTQLGLVQIGQTARVRIDSFPHKVFKGMIKEIGQTAEFTPRQSLTQKERANLVFAVKVKLENGSHLLKPGMPADVVLK
jgi:HlyD family secretion protein